MAPGCPHDGVEAGTVAAAVPGPAFRCGPVPITVPMTTSTRLPARSRRDLIALARQLASELFLRGPEVWELTRTNELRRDERGQLVRFSHREAAQHATFGVIDSYVGPPDSRFRVFDLDTDEQVDAWPTLRRGLDDAGLAWLECRSGGGTAAGQPRRHVWVVVRGSGDLLAVRGLTERRGLDDRSDKRIRPPLAPHRLRSRSTEPSVDECLDVLGFARRAYRAETGRVVRDLTPLEALLDAEGDDRSRHVMAIAARLKHRGWQGREVWEVLSDRPAGRAKLAELRAQFRGDEERAYRHCDAARRSSSELLGEIPHPGAGWNGSGCGLLGGGCSGGDEAEGVLPAAGGGVEVDEVVVVGARAGVVEGPAAGRAPVGQVDDVVVGVGGHGVMALRVAWARARWARMR